MFNQNGAAPKSPALSGPLMMVKSLLGAEAFAELEKLASAGTFQKIAKFAEAIEEQNARLERIERFIERLAFAYAQSGSGPDAGDASENDGLVSKYDVSDYRR